MMPSARQVLLIAGLAAFLVLPVKADRVVSLGLQPDPIAVDEIQIFASCTWPLDPIALASDTFLTPSLFIKDDSTMFGLVLFLVFGAGMMYMDFLEFQEDEHQKQTAAKVPPKIKEKPPSNSRAKQGWPMLPTALVVVLLSMVAASSGPVVAHAPVPCMRTPLHARTLLAVREDAIYELLLLPGMALARQPAALGGSSTAACLLAFILIGMVTMRADVNEMVLEEERASSTQSRTHEDTPPSSGRRGGKRSPRWSSRMFFCVAVAVMVGLAMMPTQEGGSAASSWSNDYALEELSEHASKGFGYGKDKIPGLHAQAPPDRIAALIISIFVAIGCKVCRSDLLHMRAEEEERLKQAQKNVKKQSAEQTGQEMTAAEKSVVDSAFWALPLLLRTALGLAMIGNVSLFAWAVQSGWLNADILKLIDAPLMQPGLGRTWRLSMPFISDEVTVLSLAIFALFGIVNFCADFLTLRAEEQEKIESCSTQEPGKSPGKKTAASACAEKKTVEAVSWLQYLSTNWRMMSCVVLLISLFGSAAAQLWENAM